MQVTKQELINYRSKKTIIKNFICINPTKTLTIDKIYKGFIESQYIGYPGSLKDEFGESIRVHIINDQNQHIAVNVSRFKEYTSFK